MKAYILIGMIGSGKSSWAKMMAGCDFNTIRLSVDDIRTMIKDRYTFDIQLEPLVWSMRNAMILEILGEGKNIIIDDCNFTRKYRADTCKNLIMAQPDVEIIYVWMRCSEEVAIKRRLSNLRGRSEFEWRQVMEKMKAAFESPSLDENEYSYSMIEVDNER